ncbi:alpha/beta fold hydrolase [Streptomyces malaysiensis]|uniref:Alpha/beta hydrolase n=1 Tax=Streptomyces malaysiensis TaxID=92644 RepID=A0A7X6B132_STRMQ|nr:alpha/beta hydrolase [Streptomyces malaysiensis]NIY69440.1 alpha/beta hydrolase [Streptomyces malaysiensis]
MIRSLATAYGTNLAFEEFGSGSPVLLLPSEEGPTSARPFAEALARDHRVLMAHHPGYGESEQLPWNASVRDLAYLYSDLLDSEGLHGIPAIGSSLGAWAALELAAMGGGQVSSVTLAGPVGIKISGIQERDFVDVYAISAQERAERAYCDPTLGALDVDKLTTEQLMEIMLSREAFTNYVWEPYLHSRSLRHHAARIRVPTLIISGAEDSLVRADYHEELAAFLPNARYVVVPECGHFPDIESPAEMVALFNEFAADAATV